MAAQDAQPSSFHWHYPDLEDKNFTLHGTTSVVVLVLVLVLLLFITLSCIYIRRGRRTSSDSSDYHESGPGAPKPTSPLGLDPKAISSLPVLLHKRTNDSDEKEPESTCSICLSEFIEGENIKMLPNCNHAFHPDCIDEWLEKRCNCPFCRTTVFKEETKKTKTEVDDSVV